MEVLTRRRELDRLDRWRGQRPLVLVPTMGALHAGHLSLVRRAARLGTAVVSVFVNPTQFGPGEDFEAYPRDLAADLALLEPLGVAAVFAPATNEIYGGETGVGVSPGPRAAPLCGATRPGHFAGVLTVVAKLFNLLRPEIAIFGRKDAQQCLVIDAMVEELCFPVRLVDHPTMREADGLAMSSRNRYLNPEQRSRAVALRRALTVGERLLGQGERRPAVVAEAMRVALAETDGIDYAELRQVPDLKVPERAEGRILLAVAAQVGPARLIDNVVLQVTESSSEETHLFGDGETS